MNSRGTYAENVRLVAEALARPRNHIAEYIVLRPDGVEAARVTEFLAARDIERTLPNGAATVTPDGRLLSYRAHFAAGSEALRRALRTIERWRDVCAMLVDAPASGVIEVESGEEVDS